MLKQCKQQKKTKKRWKRNWKLASDGNYYPPPEQLPFTPGFSKLTPGTKCFVVCPQRVEFGGVHAGIWCTIKECYKHTILVGVGRGHNNKYIVSPIYLAKPKKDGTISKQFYHNLILKSINCMIDFPKKLTSYIRKESIMGKGDKRTASKQRQKKKLKKKRRTLAERKIKAKAISSKRVKKEKKKRVTITGAIFAYFDKSYAQHGSLEKISYERCLKIAKMVKPETAFNKGHFSWYRNQYRLKRDID